jgi:hypothetical protein
MVCSTKHTLHFSIYQARIMFLMGFILGNKALSLEIVVGTSIKRETIISPSEIIIKMHKD